MVIYGCFVNNVLINSVKFSKCLDFETLLRKKLQFEFQVKKPGNLRLRKIILGFSLGRTASFSVKLKLLFNRQIFRTTQFRSRGGGCVWSNNRPMESVCCFAGLLWLFYSDFFQSAPAEKIRIKKLNFKLKEAPRRRSNSQQLLTLTVPMVHICTMKT